MPIFKEVSLRMERLDASLALDPVPVIGNIRVKAWLAHVALLTPVQPDIACNARQSVPSSPVLHSEGTPTVTDANIGT